MSFHPMLTPGIPAPDFELSADDGRTVRLADLRGRNVVLYFYPKDDTSGCTKQACEFRDAFPRFDASNAVILGVSPDDVKSHVKFKRKYELPCTLLADVGHAVAERYGVWKEKSMYGRKYWGNERTTFLIDREGRIAAVMEKVKPEGHAAEVAAALDRMG
ncbi:MAG TPA: thioredoxin-dependent thiol peroxidase [Gemmatimonadaceae bacterium]|nr:thioredoxin-dependent thiol peroxidase [Gemmatimonadaceae bacterium]